MRQRHADTNHSSLISFSETTGNPIAGNGSVYTAIRAISVRPVIPPLAFVAGAVRPHRDAVTIQVTIAELGTRIAAEFGTSRFLEEIGRLDGLASEARRTCPRSLGALIAKYRASPKFLNLAPRTRKDYQRVLDYPASRFGCRPQSPARHPGRDAEALAHHRYGQARQAVHVEWIPCALLPPDP
jgi:hypothetical protein